MLSRFKSVSDVVFTLNNAQSFWSHPAPSLGDAAPVWVHGVWSVSGLPSHLFFQKIYLERRIRLRYSSAYPFVQFRQRVRAIEPASGRRHRLDGTIVADFFVPDVGESGHSMTPTIVFVDQVNGYHRVPCTFAFRGAEETPLANDVRWSFGHPVPGIK